MENYELSQENLNELRRVHKKTREKWVADRIKVVYQVCGKVDESA